MRTLSRFITLTIYFLFYFHELHSKIKSGVSLNINTDTRTITNITLNKEYQKLQDVFGWTIDDFYNCNVNALRAAFIPEAMKKDLLGRLRLAYDKIKEELKG